MLDQWSWTVTLLSCAPKINPLEAADPAGPVNAAALLSLTEEFVLLKTEDMTPPACSSHVAIWER